MTRSKFQCRCNLHFPLETGESSLKSISQKPIYLMLSFLTSVSEPEQEDATIPAEENKRKASHSSCSAKLGFGTNDVAPYLECTSTWQNLPLYVSFA